MSAKVHVKAHERDYPKGHKVVVHQKKREDINKKRIEGGGYIMYPGEESSIGKYIIRTQGHKVYGQNKKGMTIVSLSSGKSYTSTRRKNVYEKRGKNNILIRKRKNR